MRSRLTYLLANTSVRTKVTLGIILPLVLIFGLMTIVEYGRQRRFLLTNLSQIAANAGQIIENDLRHQMLESDFDGVQDSLDSIGSRLGLRAIYVLNKEGEVMFAPGSEAVGQVLDNRAEDCQPCHSLPAAERPESVVVTAVDDQRIFRSMRPILNGPDCVDCHAAEERIIGLLLTDIPVAIVDEPLAANLRQDLLWWAAAIAVTVLIVNFVTSRLVLRRLEGLARAIDRFDGAAAPHLRVDQPDEIGRLAAAFNAMAGRIERRRRENQALSEQLRRQSSQREELLRRLISAQEDERKRVAREIHDDLGQTLGGLELRATALERLLQSDPARVPAQLHEMRTLISASSAQMYDIILDLRPAALDDLGLVPALRSHAERLLAATGIQLTLDAGDFNHRLPAEVETALFRVCQEALNNIVRHADASEARITLACRDQLFTGQIWDNGRGFFLDSVQLNGQTGRGLGLLGMQERVTQCGGQLAIQSAPGQGTTITIRIPIAEVCCE